MTNLKHRFYPALLALLPCLSDGQTTPPAAINDIRIFLDYDRNPATNVIWPRQGYGGTRELDPQEILGEVRRGMDPWQSVLPDMNYRFVATTGEANLSYEFVQSPCPGCGGQNLGSIIRIKSDALAGRDIHFMDNRLLH